jgi:flagellar protein FlbD
VIKVTRLNGREFVVNADLIQFVEQTPDTVITLTTHEKIVVKEPVDEVVRRVVEYGRQIRALTG